MFHTDAYSLIELHNQNSPKPNKRALNCTVNQVKHLIDKSVVFHVRCSENYSDPHGHFVVVDFDVELKKYQKEKPLTVDVAVKCNCLTGDTKIPLLDGRTLTLEEIHNEFGTNNSFWVYSTDENGDFKAGEAKSLGITKYTNELYHITLDNGETIKATGDHPFMNRDGTYTNAENLKVGDSLMPLYRDNHKELRTYNHKVLKIEKVTVNNVPVYDISVNKWENFLLDAGVVVHNCPAYLYWGSAYTSTQLGYGLDQNEHREPIIRDPKFDNLVCKHVAKVRLWLRNKTFKALLKNKEKISIASVRDQFPDTMSGEILDEENLVDKMKEYGMA